MKMQNSSNDYFDSICTKDDTCVMCLDLMEGPLCGIPGKLSGCENYENNKRDSFIKLEINRRLGEDTELFD